METRGKSKLRNLIMIILVAVIVICGGLSVYLMKSADSQSGSDKAVATKVSSSQQEIKGAGEESQTASTVNEGQGEAGKATSNTNSQSQVNMCTISINCKAILKNIDKLEKGKNKYVPSNGIILTTSKVEFKEGETVFDVLKRTCRAAGIQLEYTYSAAYGTNYIEGINHLYEFDCGTNSGWIYKVNGRAPNYGASGYKLKNGDSIVWSYTCSGKE